MPNTLKPLQKVIPFILSGKMGWNFACVRHRWELLRLRYIEGLREDAVIRALYIGRTTYYTKELEVLSTVGIYAAQAGLLREEGTPSVLPSA